ncbi:MAG: DoxX family protein [Oceanobacter sp.]
MNTLMQPLQSIHSLFNCTRHLDFIAPLALRVYLAAVFWMAGMNKVSDFDNVILWFGNEEWGLGLPFPALMATLATGAEVVGAIFLLVGFATRYICVPLMVTMIVAAVSVHWDYGWQAVADLKSPGVSEATHEAVERLERARSILREYGNYEWLTANGRFSYVISNNGIEWAATYFIMLLVLFFQGAGRYLSVDYWIARKFESR